MALDIADQSPVHTQLHNDAVLEMNYANGNIEGGHYPERPGKQDCAYYMKTGVCKFGMTCRFNHPPDIESDIYGSGFECDFPERVGEPECQYYLKTGTCKFGAICKFHHPKDKVETDDTVPLNILGYPLRESERECSYYLRTGICKFGTMCKFHHPYPSSSKPTLHSSPAYSSVKSSTTSTEQASNLEGDANYDMLRTYHTASPSWQGFPSYSPQFLLPSGVVPVSSWNAAYTGQPGSFSTPENMLQTSLLGMFGWQKDNIYPERPHQPLCQFYMKTGGCKFGAICKFHHPKGRSIPAPTCLLSPLGLPLRPGEPPCTFYSRFGICKFGPNCKFDHPIGTFTYGLPLSSLSDVSVVRRMLYSIRGTAALPKSIPGEKSMPLAPQIFSKDEETFDDDKSQ